VSYAALGLARKICGDLRHVSVLVVGAGEMAELTARHFAAQQPKRMTVCSRTTTHAEALAAEVGGSVVGWSELDAALGQADVVVTATGATKPILDRARVQAVLRHRRGRPLFLIDIAMPRDVEPAAAEADDVFLYNIDDLQSIVNESLARRNSETSRAESIVNQEVERFMAWARSRTAMPTVVALRQRFDAIRRAELDRLAPKIAGLPPEARARVDEITRLIIEKLLITPTEQLKALPDQELQSSYADALSHLFALDDRDDEDDDEPGAPPAGGPPREFAGS
jgi:glutamyl-tRNA reductase